MEQRPTDFIQIQRYREFELKFTIKGLSE